MRVQLDGGEVVELGETGTTPTIGITDYSRRVTDDYGVTTVVPRGFARRLSVRLAVPLPSVDALQRRLADLRATAATWIADDRYTWLTVRGFYKDFTLDLAGTASSFCTLTVEGLAETETVVDPGGDPAPDGQASTLQLLSPLVLGDAMLIGSSVAENDYAEWSGATSYPLGARVMKAAAHRVYESAVAANVGNDPVATVGSWLDIGPTNRWAMFDQALGTATAAGGSITVTLNPGAVGALALLDVVASTVRVQATDYDRTVSAGPGAVTFLDLPTTGGQVTVTIAGTGQVQVGSLLIGSILGLGITEVSPSAGITDYSRKVVDDFGEVSVVQRAFAKRMTAKALIRTAAIDVVANRIAAVRARAALWLGQSELDSLTVYGFFKDFSIEAGETVSKLSLTIEGLSKAAPIAPVPVVLVPRGTYDAAISYGNGDVVQFDGSSWLYINAAATSGNAPPSYPTDENAFWRVFARGGVNGSDGLPGAAGADGVSERLHIAYANSADGTVDFTTGGPGGRTHLGVLVDHELADSTNPVNYAWSLVKGADGLNGDDGTPGAPGSDGRPTYVHIAYANAPDGTVDFSRSDPIRAYVGFYVDQTLADSTNPAAYAWSLIKGTSGTSQAVIYTRSLPAPATPTGNTPAGWVRAVPVGTNTLWASTGTLDGSGSLIGTWALPSAISTHAPRGGYDPAATYYLTNDVTYGGGTYSALQDGFSGQAPSGTSSATAYWSVVSAPGAPGAPATAPSAFSATINLGSGAAVNLHDAAVAAGYTDHSDATITFAVPSGVTIRGLAGGIGLDTGDWPTGSYAINLTLVVQSGAIVDGGGGGGGSASYGAGGAGGDAIYVRVPMTGGVTVNAGGVVRGGGGGGASGYGATTRPNNQFPSFDDPYSGGGGGGGGAPNGPAGDGEYGTEGGNDGASGNAGTASGGGSGGGGYVGGGYGGGFGAAGSNIGVTSSGPAGYAVRKNGNAVTVSNSGTLTGSAA